MQSPILWFPIVRDKWLPEKYTLNVKEGNHYYNAPLLILSKENVWHYKVFFPASQKHDELPEGEKGDWSKVGGLTPRLWSHKKDSAMWVYKCLDDQLMIGPYTHDGNKVHKNDSAAVFDIDQNKYYNLKIVSTPESYQYFALDFSSNMVAEHPRYQNNRNIIRKIPPYVGGDNVAQQDTFLKFKKIN